MKKICVGLLCALSLSAVAGEPWKWSLRDQKARIDMRVDLVEESVEVPGMEMFGPMHGYMSGAGLYGTWTITSAKIESDRRARVRLSNDLGSETQEVELVHVGDTLVEAHLLGTTVMKRVVGGRKLVKIDPLVLLK